MGISPYKLAKDINISATRVSEIIKAKKVLEKQLAQINQREVVVA